MIIKQRASLRFGIRCLSNESKLFPAIKTPMLPPDTFKNKVAFVTGGGTGLGRAMSEMLSKLGAQVFITSRKQDVLEKASNEIRALTGNPVGFYAADVRKVDEIQASIDACIKQFGLPSVIINNAAGNFISPTERLSPNAIKSIVDIVLLGTLNVTILLGKKLIQEKKGASFLAILANYVNHGSAFVVPSACAKTGVGSMTKSLAVEWAKYGMRFNAISPGPIYTKGAFNRLDPTGAFVDKIGDRIPIGRLGEKEELANLATYICSDYANWLNGEIINFDGGELVNLAGEFNFLSGVSQDQWDQMEKLIRQVKSS